MQDQGPGELGGFGDEVAGMLHARALRHPDHADPIGMTRKHLRAAKGRRRTALGATATLVVAGGAIFGSGYVGLAHDNGTGAGAGSSKGTTSGANGSAPDYSAAATCAANMKVPVDVPRGATTTAIAHALFEAGVVKSENAYINAANHNQGSADIGAGTYVVCPRISGDNAVLELLKKSNLSDASQIIVQPHEWAKDVIASLIDKRKWRQADFDAVIQDNTIGLPAWSKDSLTGQFTVEGMLEPGTYSLTSSDTPQSVLTQMVANRMTFLKSIDFETKAAALTCGTTHCTPEQVLTVASIAEGEVTDPSDGQKVAEGVYTRLKDNDYLGVDSTALYYIGHLPAGKLPTVAQVQDPNNPYSTYAPHHGLPPTPVYDTSDDMIKSALTPAHQGTYYWCVTSMGTEFFMKSQTSAFKNYCNSAR
ncbi:endolytic transglycosylase MltG [Catenulispora pinisilvae]|uniref:endolytic transglycosylase MltG n=1 Tax=Catenulispora pinisilvae TaxID=2705253 RepID=UPI0018916F5A|nr:endolytic transglycosylase MltG [Catenulispora pinisilvae]